LAEEGLGGTYFLRDASAQQPKVAVFKPADEEPFAPQNPRDMVGPLGSPGVRSGVLSGEANLREVAAAILDTEGLAGVPPTARVEVRHKFFGATAKVGSLQLFCDFDDVVGDLSPSLFQAEQVQRIALLDIRLLNADRNEGNLLVRKVPAPVEAWRRKPARKRKGSKDPPSVSIPMPPRAAGGGRRTVDYTSYSGEEEYDRASPGTGAYSPEGTDESSPDPFFSASPDIFFRDSPEALSSPEELWLREKSPPTSPRGSEEVGRGTPDWLDEYGSEGSEASDEEEPCPGGDVSLWASSSASHSSASASPPRFELIPIDHGYILSTLEITWWDWTWLSWKQIKEPIAPSLVAWVERVDPEAEVRALELQLGRVLPHKVRMMLRLTTRLLKLTVKAGLTLREIAELVAREDQDEPSVFERIVAQAANLTELDPRAAPEQAQAPMEAERGTRERGGRGVALQRSFSDNQINKRGAAIPLTRVGRRSTDEPRPGEERGEGEDGEGREEGEEEEQEEDLMTSLSKRVQNIPDGFWTHFESLLSRAVAKVKGVR